MAEIRLWTSWIESYQEGRPIAALLFSALHDDPLGGAGDAGVRPLAPIMLVVLIDQQHLVPFGALALVDGQALAVVERADKLIVIIVINRAAFSTNTQFGTSTSSPSISRWIASSSGWKLLASS